MIVSLVSNPPYNMKWKHPLFAQMQSRFAEYELPPESNANFAFILTALELVTSKAVFILPNTVLSTANKAELEIKQLLVERIYIEAVILCPRNMFESTDISTCIIIFNKHKDTTDIMCVDMRNAHGEEERRQKGQFGGASHERRTYTKSLNVFREEDMQKALSAIQDRSDVPMFSRRVSAAFVAENDYNLTPSRYIELEAEMIKRREYADIYADLNRIIAERNCCKLTVNETVARALGLNEVAELQKISASNYPELSKTASLVGCQIEKDDYITLSKNKNEIRFENNNKDRVSSILTMIFQTWKQHIYYLNNEENRLLVELRDTMLTDLMGGQIQVVAPKAEMAATISPKNPRG